jgi:hypothetical protein
MDIFMYGTFLIYLGDWVLLNVLVGISILFVFVVLNIFLIHFFKSFTWLFVELGDVFMDWYWNNIQGSLSNYPFKIFEQNNILFSLLSALPMFYVSVLIVPVIAFGDFSVLFEINYFLILSMVLIMSVGIFFNWRYGLKNYEAFG